MTQEEKAKAYDEALEKARIYRDNAKAVDEYSAVARYENIFPELRESEEERMMREFNDWLCEEIEWRTNDVRDEKDRRTLNMLCYVLTKVKDWLEKRKEQKPIEDVVKDITKNKESAIKFLKSTGIMDDNGELAEMYRSEQRPVDYDHEMWKNCEANFEGGKKEVIDHPEKYGLQKEQKPNYCHHEVDETGWTEEYRKAYYDGWNNCNMQHEQLKADHKPAEWSEEDEAMLDSVIRIITQIDDIAHEPTFAGPKWTHPYTKEIAWLKSIRPQPKQEWSDEDEKIFNNIIEKAKGGHWIEVNEITWLINRFKSLRPSWKPTPEQLDTLHTAAYLPEMEFYGGLKYKLRELYEHLINEL